MQPVRRQRHWQSVGRHCYRERHLPGHLYQWREPGAHDQEQQGLWLRQERPVPELYLSWYCIRSQHQPVLVVPDPRTRSWCTAPKHHVLGTPLLSSIHACGPANFYRGQNWDGNVVDGVQRPPIQLICADGAPCVDIHLSNVNMWSQSNRAVVKCESAYGSGVGCIKNSSSHTSYAVVTQSVTKPAGYSTPTTMAGDLASGFATNAAIPTP